MPFARVAVETERAETHGPEHAVFEMTVIHVCVWFHAESVQRRSEHYEPRAPFFLAQGFFPYLYLEFITKYVIIWGVLWKNYGIEAF